MENLSPESRTLYELLKTATREEYERRFISYKTELLDAVKLSINDTTVQIQGIQDSLDEVRAMVSSDLTALSSDLVALCSSFTMEIASLSEAITKLPRPTTDAETARSGVSFPQEPRADAVGLDGHRCHQFHRGQTSASHLSPPVGGMCPDRDHSQFPTFGPLNTTDGGNSGPRVELPQFDGSNPKLWQRHCVEYFQRWQTPEAMWVSYASGQFIGAAATWLEAYLQQSPDSLWVDFAAAVVVRFSRNQHQILVRCLFDMYQITTVEDYVARFSALMDQISAYESRPDPVHYTTWFLDGLKQGVRILVAIQQPKGLDIAYSLALLYEELGDGCSPHNVHSPPMSPLRRHQFSPSVAPLPPPPTKWLSKSTDEKRPPDLPKPSADEKWQSLKAYRRSKGICFICGEKWNREHQCKNTIQLHVVQEMIEFMQQPEDIGSEHSEPDNVSADPHLMMLSVAAMDPGHLSPKSMQLKVEIQGKQMLFLIDSGSSSCIIDSTRAMELQGRAPLPAPVQVKVAGGVLLPSDEFLLALQWTTEGHTFIDSFRILPLGSYDGIIGLDWLAKFSPMTTHWA
jgi:hypothetical protein